VSFLSKKSNQIFKNLVISQPDVLQLPEGGDFEALHCQPSTNFDRSTALDLTTSAPIAANCCVCPDEDREMMGEGLPIILVGQDYQTARRCWGRNFLVLSVRVKLCQQEWRLVRVAKRNTDEPLVEASIVGMRC